MASTTQQTAATARAFDWRAWVKDWPYGWRRALVFALTFAVLWWLVVMLIDLSGLPVVPWRDQRLTFTVSTNVTDPYVVPTFLYPPWTVFFLLPNSVPPFYLSTLLQAIAYFVILTAVIFKYGGGRREVLLTLASYSAFDAVLQLNLEWIVCLGLLVPYPLSGIFFAVKPQIAFGAWFGWPLRRVLIAGAVLAGVAGISLLLWPDWIGRMLNAIETYTLGSPVYTEFNLAPSKLLPAPVSYAIGVVIALIAFRRKDVPLGILAWIFFVPYLMGYTLLLFLGMVAIKSLRLALIIFITTWVVYGGTVVLWIIEASRLS